ncbi:hypothetical protein [Geomicrobium sp. JCM 19038]|uniref:hypothetical protein n=1 Tax=Geomicrobium sp. JCM 19038 TaxID=1460635 RepID=UPI0005A7446D|nr:hypothetical protein [Geomicrobium sp. JCM 19038]
MGYVPHVHNDVATQYGSRLSGKQSNHAAVLQVARVNRYTREQQPSSYVKNMEQRWLHQRRLQASVTGKGKQIDRII